MADTPARESFAVSVADALLDSGVVRGLRWRASVVAPDGTAYEPGTAYEAEHEGLAYRLVAGQWRGKDTTYPVYQVEVYDAGRDDLLGVARSWKDEHPVTRLVKAAIDVHDLAVAARRETALARLTERRAGLE